MFMLAKNKTKNLKALALRTLIFRFSVMAKNIGSIPLGIWAYLLGFVNVMQFVHFSIFDYLLQQLLFLAV